MSAHRRVINCALDHPEDAASTDSYGTYASSDGGESLRPLTAESFRAGLGVQYVSGDGSDELVFDVVGIPPNLANAVRRVLLAEVPTMAFESVWIVNNTSVIPDEVLAHRIGLVPILADPDRFEPRPAGDADPTDANTLVFELKARCEKDKPASTKMLSSDLVWVPQGDQESTFADCPPRPVHPDILLAKLRPGQEIEALCYAHLGIGKDHAKFSPVATACYRLLPHVELLRPVVGDDARRLVETCAAGVFDVEECEGEEVKAKVVDARRCTMCRNCIREEVGLTDAVRIGRVRDHFIFSVESTGIVPARKLFRDALKVISAKCDRVLQAIENKPSPMEH
jgi:DNA-directed RNA polymerase I and III subunit RPAC1